MKIVAPAGKFDRRARVVLKGPTERHVLRLYPEAEVVDALEAAGFSVKVRGGYADP